MIREIGVASGVAVALAMGVASSASAGTLDQQQTSSNNNESLVANPDQSGAQTFTAGISGGLDQADLKLIKFGTPPATVTVEIRTTSGGSPTATVLATGTITTSAVGDSPGFVPVTFAMPAPVTAGMHYALVAYSAGASGSGDLVAWSEGGGDPYAGGQFFLSFDPLPPGANWSGAPMEDFAFKTYVVPGPPTPPGNTVQPARKKCKKKHKRSAELAKKKHCKKHKKR